MITLAAPHRSRRHDWRLPLWIALALACGSLCAPAPAQDVAGFVHDFGATHPARVGGLSVRFVPARDPALSHLRDRDRSGAAARRIESALAAELRRACPWLALGGTARVLVVHLRRAGAASTSGFEVVYRYFVPTVRQPAWSAGRGALLGRQWIGIDWALAHQEQRASRNLHDQLRGWLRDQLRGRGRSDFLRRLADQVTLATTLHLRRSTAPGGRGWECVVPLDRRLFDGLAAQHDAFRVRFDDLSRPARLTDRAAGALDAPLRDGLVLALGGAALPERIAAGRKTRQVKVHFQPALPPPSPASRPAAIGRPAASDRPSSQTFSDFRPPRRQSCP